MPDQPTAVAMRLANVADKVLSPLAVADPHHVVMRVARALDDAGVREAVEHLERLVENSYDSQDIYEAKAALAALTGETQEVSDGE